jgi:hypothetical protein
MRLEFFDSGGRPLLPVTISGGFEISGLESPGLDPRVDEVRERFLARHADLRDEIATMHKEFPEVPDLIGTLLESEENFEVLALRLADVMRPYGSPYDPGYPNFSFEHPRGFWHNLFSH